MNARLVAVRALVVGTAIAVGGLGGGLALAQGAPPSGSLTGTVSQIIPATSTAAEEIVVSPQGTTGADTFALAPSTTYTLAAPGLDSLDVALSAAALAVGETVSVTAASQATSPASLAGVWVHGALVVGQVTAIVQGSAFDVTAGGSVTQVADTGLSASVVPAVGADVAVYGIPTGTNALTGYAVYTQAYPPVTGTITTVGNGAITLAADAGSFTAALPAAVPVNVGSAPAGQAFLLPGAQATVTYSVSEAGAATAQVQLTPTTISGTLVAAPQTNAGVTTFTVATGTNSSQAVAATAATTVTGGSLASAQAGTAVTVTGVLASNLLTALSVTLGTATTPSGPPTPPVPPPTRISGTVAAVSASSITVDAEDGPFTATLTSATQVQVGSESATLADLAPGQEVSLRLVQASGPSGSSGGTPQVAAVAIRPQHLRGTVTAVTSQTAFTVQTPEGESVAVTVAPGAGVSGSVAVGNVVQAQGLDMAPAAFEAFALMTRTPPPMSVHGTITALTATSITVAGGGPRPEHAGRRGDPPAPASVTFTLAGATQVFVGDRSMSIDALAVGEAVDVTAAPGSLVAATVRVRPSHVAGTVVAVATSGSDTVLTVAAHGPGPRPLAPAARALDAGGPRTAGSVAVTVLPDTQVSSPGASQAPALAVGQRIDAMGGWTGTTLMAAAVVVLPAQGGPAHGGH